MELECIRAYKLKSYGKVNLYLNVLNKRKTDGYHNIKTLFSTISLCDYLELKIYEASDGILRDINIEDMDGYYLRLRCFGESAYGLNGKDNILYKVLSKLKSNLNGCIESLGGGRKLLLDIKLIKRIPQGGGLGGGSSNAAQLLRVLNKEFMLGYSKEELLELGVGVGADVPFLLYGGLAKGRGLGEELEYYESYKYHIVLVYPEVESTSIAGYRELGRGYEGNILYGEEDDAKIEKIVEGLKSRDIELLEKNMYNAFFEIVVNVKEEVMQLYRDFEKAGARVVLMSGSGSSIYSIFFDEVDAKRVYKGLKLKYKRVYLCHSISGY